MKCGVGDRLCGENQKTSKQLDMNSISNTTSKPRAKAGAHMHNSIRYPHSNRHSEKPRTRRLDSSPREKARTRRQNYSQREKASTRLHDHLRKQFGTRLLRRCQRNKARTRCQRDKARTRCQRDKARTRCQRDKARTRCQRDKAKTRRQRDKARTRSQQGDFWAPGRADRVLPARLDTG